MRATRIWILGAIVTACLFMSWPTSQARARSSDQQLNGEAIAQARSGDTAGREQTPSLRELAARDAEMTKQSDDLENESASAESRRLVRGEFYGAVYGGYTIGHGIAIEGTGLGSFIDLGTIGLKDSGMFGGKLGYFFPGRGNWAGVEMEAFRTTPDVKGTTTGATIAGFPIPLAGRQIPGAQLTVTTVAINTIARAKFMYRPEIGANTLGSMDQEQERSAWCPLR